MYAKNLHSHSDNLRKITEIHNERLKFWHDFYTREKAIMLKEFRESIEEQQEKFKDSKCELECIYYTLEEEIATNSTNAKNNRTTRLTEFQNMVSH